MFGARPPGEDDLLRAGEGGAWIAREDRAARRLVAIGIEGDGDDRAVSLEEGVQGKPVGNGIRRDINPELDEIGRVPAVTRVIRRVVDVPGPWRKRRATGAICVAPVIIVEIVLVEVFAVHVCLRTRNEERRGVEARIAVLELRSRRRRSIEHIRPGPRTAGHGRQGGSGACGNRVRCVVGCEQEKEA